MREVRGFRAYWRVCEKILGSYLLRYHGMIEMILLSLVFVYALCFVASSMS